MPSPRAGMSLSNIQNKLYLFGGSGHSAMCFNDLNIFKPDLQRWEQIKCIFINHSSEPINQPNNSTNNVMSQNGNHQQPEEQPMAPEARAGHSATAVNSKLIVFGGSYGPNYFQDLYILESDPQPEFQSECNSRQKILGHIQEYLNNQELSDVVFIVDGKKFYGHRLILSLLSEKFKAMFTSIMLESQQKVIEVSDVRYPVFAAIMRFLYTGEVDLENEGQENTLEYLVDFLRVADEYVIDPIKNECEKRISF